MEQRTKKAWSRLDQEVAERNADFDHIRVGVLPSTRVMMAQQRLHCTRFPWPQDAFSSALEAMESMVEGSSQRAFDSIEKSRLRLAHARCEQITAAEEQAYQHDVPELVAKLIGPARKQMQKAHESFDVENAKVLAREQRLVAGMDDFEAKTQARFGMEEQDRALQVATVAEQLSGQLLFPVRVDRCHQRARIMPAVRGVQESLAAEQAARTAGDAFARSSMAAASERLQAVVLDNFGGESDASGTDAGSEASESDSD